MYDSLGRFIRKPKNLQVVIGLAWFSFKCFRHFLLLTFLFPKSWQKTTLTEICVYENISDY